MARECGYDVYCYSADRTAPAGTTQLPCTLLTDETPAFLVDASVPHPIRVWRVFRNMLAHAKRVRKLGMDVISCHNIRGLAVAWMAFIGIHGRRRPRLIYDSHEFELGRKPRSQARYALLKWVEGFLARRCAFVIVVNESIGDELTRIHHLKQKPVAVRSTPEYWEIDEVVSREVRKQYVQKLGVQENTFILSYTGIFMPYRGLEQIIEAMSISGDVCAVWVGEPETEAYRLRIEEMIQETGITDRLLVYPIQPHEVLWKYVSATDTAIVVMNDNKIVNYRYALPNKFFEAIQSLTPVICSETVEMAKIVRQYNIGLLVPSGDGAALSDAVQKMKSDEELYRTFKRNLTVAKRELCWENEKRVLQRAFKTHLGIK